MRGPKRTKTQRERDLEEIAHRYCRGEFQASIGRDLGITQQQVSYDVKELIKRWQAAGLASIDERKVAELAKVDELERTYWTEWERSKEDRVLDKEHRLGDPRYLAGVQWCIERRCKILGIDTPERQEVAGLVGQAIEIRVIYENRPGGDERAAVGS